MIVRQLNVFLTVCRTESMTAAAEELYMTQPAVSQTIRELEEHYQTKLFERLPRRLEITESGRQLKRSAEKLLNSLEEMEIRVRETDKDMPVRIGVNLSVGNALLIDLLKRFKGNHPDSGVRVVCTRGSVLEKMLMDNDLDLLLMEKPANDDRFELKPFYKDRIVVVARPDDPILEKPDLKLADISGEHILLREKGAGVREQFDRICLAHKLSIVPYWESSSTTVLVNAVIAGEGIAVLPYLMIRDRLEKGEIKELKVSDISLSRILYLVRYPGRRLSRAALDFADIISFDK